MIFIITNKPFLYNTALIFLFFRFSNKTSYIFIPFCSLYCICINCSFYNNKNFKLISTISRRCSSMPFSLFGFAYSAQSHSSLDLRNNVTLHNSSIATLLPLRCLIKRRVVCFNVYCFNDTNN